MLITSACRRLKLRPIKPTMSLLYKVTKVKDKAVGEVGEVDEVDPMPV